MFSSPNALSHMGAHEDEGLYELVARELQAGNLRMGLWTKALGKSMGDEVLAKSLYIEARVEQLREEASEKEDEDRKSREEEHRIRQAGKYLKYSLFLIGFAILIVFVGTSC
ncbi:hypothetical protein N9903_01775 [bacterium]|nr:hypothetical protein [bacterium]